MKRTCFGDSNLILMTNVCVNERFHYSHSSSFAYIIHTLKCIRLMRNTEKNSHIEKKSTMSLPSSNSPTSCNCLHLHILSEYICIEAYTYMYADLFSLMVTHHIHYSAPYSLHLTYLIYYYITITSFLIVTWYSVQ